MLIHIIRFIKKLFLRARPYFLIIFMDFLHNLMIFNTKICPENCISYVESLF